MDLEAKRLKRNLRTTGNRQRLLGNLGPDHVAVPLIYDGKAVYIDYKISWLIEMIWRNGIRTWACCQGDKKQKAYIMFERLEDVQKFVKTLGRSNWDLTNSINGYCNDNHDNWKIELHIPSSDFSLPINNIGMTIRFPSRQIKIMEEIFESL